MPYGIESYNYTGAKVLDGSSQIVLLSDEISTETVRGGSSWLKNFYEPAIKQGSFFAFQLLPTYNNIAMVKRSKTGYNYNFRTVETTGLVRFNDTNLGSKNFRYITISDKTPKGTGGYGMEIWNEAGSKIYRFDDKVLKIDSIFSLNELDTVTLPNNCWLCPLMVQDSSNEVVVMPPELLRISGNTWRAEVANVNEDPSRFHSLWLRFTI